jgi:hypothetical protein
MFGPRPARRRARPCFRRSRIDSTELLEGLRMSEPSRGERVSFKALDAFPMEKRQRPNPKAWTTPSHHLLARTARFPSLER